ncbi:MAG TPA: bifunctional diguanylate cyclase/phosphodiesterase [Marivita sp.]|nr:bifunctional diguanylate cyclase/phosphodiesterase [Marivita sp.]
MRIIHIKAIQDRLRRGLFGAHMFAFLPALCLAAFWTGGEPALISFALAIPVIYAATGGFGLTTEGPMVAPEVVDWRTVAQDFLEIAHHNGQITACFQIGVSGLDRIAITLGDEAAQEARDLVKGRLKTSLRSGDQVFQSSTDRFTVFLSPGFRLKLDDLIDVAKRLRISIEEPLSVSNTTQYLTAAIGVASSLNFPRNVTLDSWVTSAGQALAEAAANNPSATRVWSERLSHSVQSRRSLCGDVPDALQKGEIEAYFQPQFSLRTNAIIGMEALARWNHPVRGLVEPSDFLRSLRESGALEDLGKMMLVQSLSLLREWDLDGLDVPTVSVNLSNVEMRNPDFVSHVAVECDRFGLPPHRLRIDIAEGDILALDDASRTTLISLSDLGCCIDLDDFGSAAATVQDLQTLPINRLKLDRSLIAQSDRDETKRRAVSAVLSMAQKLDFDTLAEGVETVEEASVLRELGCTYAQGFLFAKPMSGAECRTWLHENKNRHVKIESTGLRSIK